MSQYCFYVLISNAPQLKGRTAEPVRFAPAELVVYGNELLRMESVKMLAV